MSSFCPGCGNGLSADERYCGICGKDSQADPGVAAVDPSIAFGLAPETSGKAIFSLVCAILFFLLPFAMAAIVFGHLSLSEIRRSAGRLTGKGLAIAGLALGYIGVAAFVALMTLGFVVQRSERRAAMAAQRTNPKQNAAVTALRTLNTAEIAYAQAHPASGYTCSLTDLSDAWGIGTDLAHGEKSGYVFRMQGCRPGKNNGPVSKYQIVAYPMSPNRAGAPTYCSNESDRIRVAPNGSPEDCLSKGSDWMETEAKRPQGVAQTSAH
jgi:hypothetical protein